MKSILFLFALFAFGPISADITKDHPTLTISASGALSKPADQLQLNLGVISTAETAEKALNDNNLKMENLIQSIEAVGLSKKDYRTGRFSIQPTYTPYPKDPPPNWKPTIIGYEVNNSLSINTDQIELAGTLIDAAVKAGANSLENIQFTLKESKSHWNEAIAIATLNAIEEAQVIANAANVKLSRLLEISLDQEQAPRPNHYYLAKATSTESVAPIEAGEVKLTATVRLVYEISK